jgi:hypothetical protein
MVFLKQAFCPRICNLTVSTVRLYVETADRTVQYVQYVKGMEGKGGEDIRIAVSWSSAVPVRLSPSPWIT